VKNIILKYFSFPDFLFSVLNLNNLFVCLYCRQDLWTVSELKAWSGSIQGLCSCSSETAGSA